MGYRKYSGKSRKPASVLRPMLLLLCCLLALPAVAYLIYPPFRNTVSFAIWQFGLKKSPDLTQAFIEMPNTKIVASVRLSGQEHLEFFRQIISQLLKNRQELSKHRLDLLNLLNDAQLSGLIPDPVKASVLEEEKKYSTGTENLIEPEAKNHENKILSKQRKHFEAAAFVSKKIRRGLLLLRG